MGESYDRKRTLAEAQAMVDAYIQPRECFVVHTGNQWGWQAYSYHKANTPCAHYVSHILEMTARSGTVCQKGYLLRVRDVVERLGDPIEPGEAVAGDVWARIKGVRTSGGGREPTSHCGMVSRVATADDGTTAITIKHCSSGQRLLAENDWDGYFKRSGFFYRRPGDGKSARTEANLDRMVRGFEYRQWGHDPA
ncbi:MAG: hypothetical protein U0133_03795 [Gemmatimonadales bacterium]